METIRQLLDRIRWDAEFGKGDFEVGVYDRVEATIRRISLDKLHFKPGCHDLFWTELDGIDVSIPFHRVREVWKNGDCIWSRRRPS